MYIKDAITYYTTRGGQAVKRAPFLILLQQATQDIGPLNLRAIVRKVAMRQCGQFMMGSCRIKNQTIQLSGSYGSDGLPISATKEIFDMGVKVPKHLYDAWNSGEGWNSCGNEAAMFREWAIKTFNIE